MDSFFSCLVKKFGDYKVKEPLIEEDKNLLTDGTGNDDIQCEEELLAAFGGKK
jgi:hypothetical protein